MTHTDRYILAERIALRSWRFVPYAYYAKNSRNANGLKKEEYALLKLCDGTNELQMSPLLESLINRGFCQKVKGNEKLSTWQREKVCDNRYFPALNWMITGRCNFNCLHCFNAADNNRLQSEFSLEEAETLIAEAEKCGINAITITGGEPMLHPGFLDIIRSIYSHGMYVEELNTNGFFLTQEILDEMKQVGCIPMMKISFDGIGYHDILRNCKGAEDAALRAIRLCVYNGFPVKVQTNVNRMNTDVMLRTATMLDDMGVSVMRIIRTSESPRWMQNSGADCLSFEEYFDAMLRFLEDYVQTNSNMDIEIWQFANIFPRCKMYYPIPVQCVEGKYRDSLPVCRSNRGMIAVAADGNLYPCHQLSGTFAQHKLFLGNVKKDGLQKHLQGGAYLQCVCTTVKDLKEHNKKCAECKWLKYCCGGCRAISFAATEDFLGIDPSKCLFFNAGYLEKLQSVLSDYHMTII